MAIRRKKPEKKPAKKKPEKKKPAKKKKTKVNPGGPNIPDPTTGTGTTTSSTPASSVVASEDMSSAPVDGTASGASDQTGTAADTSDSIFSTGAGYTPHYHTTVPAAEQYAAESTTQTSEVSPI